MLLASLLVDTLSAWSVVAPSLSPIKVVEDMMLIAVGVSVSTVLTISLVVALGEVVVVEVVLMGSTV